MSWQVCVRDAQGVIAEREGGAWLVEEHSTVTVEVIGPRCTAHLLGHDLPWRRDRSGFRLELPYAVGLLELELRGEHDRGQVLLRVLPAGHKLGPALWGLMLTELEGWLAGLSVGIEAPTSGGVSTTGVASTWLVQAVLPLLPALEKALGAVLDTPRQLDVEHLIEVPLHRTREAAGETLAWLSSHPQQAAWLNPHRLLPGQPPQLPVWSTRDTVDHPANRHVAWLVRQVIHRLREVADQLARARFQELNDTATWAAARAALLRHHADRLDRMRRASWLRDLNPETASETAMLVVLDQPAYGRLNQLARRVLNTALSVVDDEHSAPVRPTFELYELWCFLAMARLLREGLNELGLRWTRPDLRPLLSLQGRQPPVSVRGSAPNLEVRLDFQPRFRGWLARRSAHTRFTLSAPRVPDLTLAVRHGSQVAWVVFDAKYSASAGGLGRAFESAHLYRDALRWSSYGGAPSAGLLLAPRVPGPAASWASSDFRDRYGLGVLALCPETEVDASFLPWLRQVLPLPALEACA